MFDYALEARLAKVAAMNGMSLIDGLYSHDKDWAHRIDPLRLDIASDCNCIVGQLSGSYNDNVQYFTRGDKPQTFGFYETKNVSFSALTTAYQKLILCRQVQSKQQLLLAA